ncbi:DegT/DnrJ/EryC1/StrS family aminotransferase [Nocardia sp. NPDC051990]|uniref:DegT/DnrJ/EryC1/StrS family aminotransferase n=1 Tax=Nocardia sp. NPDC051990 TaxID=3155285 RepID=UPI003427A65D
MIPPFTAALPEQEIQTVTAAVEQILHSGQLVLGPHTTAFEKAVADMAGTRYAVAVNSGSTALEIIFRFMDVRGRVVLVPTNTNYATAIAAMHAGARVQLYDSGLYPDITDIERRLTPEVAAVVVVHIGGYLSQQLPHLAGLCKRLGVLLIEDAAHAHGSTLGTRPAGSLGYAAAFSFFATKTITTGEGGAITTNDPELAQMARVYRNQDKDDHGRRVVVGGSWRMTELGAALGTAQLDHLDSDLRHRRAVIDRYSRELSDIGLTFPALHGQISGHKCITMLASDINRNTLREKIFAAGVELARGIYEQPLHRQPVFCGLNIADSFPVADDFAARHLCLPLWRGMTDNTVACVIDTVRRTVAADT